MESGNCFSGQKREKVGEWRLFLWPEEGDGWRVETVSMARTGRKRERGKERMECGHLLTLGQGEGWRLETLSSLFPDFEVVFFFLFRENFYKYVILSYSFGSRLD